MKRKNWIWFFLKILPLVMVILCSFLQIYNYKGANAQVGFDKVTDSLSSVSNIIQFRPVASVLYNIVLEFIGAQSIAQLTLLIFVVRYISYLVFIEIAHIMYQVLVFLPVFIGNLFERKMKNE